jgi:hypothetical protein
MRPGTEQYQPCSKRFLVPVQCDVIDSCSSAGTLPGVSIVKHLFTISIFAGIFKISLSLMCLPVYCGVIYRPLFFSWDFARCFKCKIICCPIWSFARLFKNSLSSMCLPVQCGVIDPGSGTGLRQVDELAPVELQGLGG